MKNTDEKSIGFHFFHKVTLQREEKRTRKSETDRKNRKSQKKKVNETLDKNDEFVRDLNPGPLAP